MIKDDGPKGTRLRLVKDEHYPPRESGREGRRKHQSTILSPAEQAQARQALKNIRDAQFGKTWAEMGRACGVAKNTLQSAANGYHRVSTGVLFRVSMVTGISIAEMLGLPVTADRCRACGQLKPRIVG